MSADTSTPPGIAIVTGGGRGIGRAVVERLAARGHHVLFTYSQDAAAAETVAASCRERGGLATALACDVADPDSPSRILDAAAALGECRVLVNNAGITGRLGPIETLGDDDLDRVFAVNVTGLIRLTRDAVRRFGDRGLRSIVNVSSIASVTGSPGEYTWYAASKAAVDAFTVGLAKELAPRGIRVNAVRAGTTRTRIHADAGDPGRPERVGRVHPFGRIAEPYEVAAAVDWLISDDASYVNGELMNVTGGLP